MIPTDNVSNIISINDFDFIAAGAVVLIIVIYNIAEITGAFQPQKQKKKSNDPYDAPNRINRFCGGKQVARGYT